MEFAKSIPFPRMAARYVATPPLNVWIPPRRDKDLWPWKSRLSPKTSLWLDQRQAWAKTTTGYLCREPFAAPAVLAAARLAVAPVCLVAALAVRPVVVAARFAVVAVVRADFFAVVNVPFAPDDAVRTVVAAPVFMLRAVF